MKRTLFAVLPGLVVAVLCVHFAALQFSPSSVPSASAGENEGAAAFYSDLFQVEVTLGKRTTEAVRYEGTVTVREGQLVDLQVVRGRRGVVQGNRFSARSQRQGGGRKRKKQVVFLPVALSITARGGTATEVVVESTAGTFSFRPFSLAFGKRTAFLRRSASVLRLQPAVRLRAPRTEDDFPAAACTKDGTVWVAYVAYTPAKEIDMEAVKKHDFSSLRPKGHGDQVLLRQFTGGRFHTPIAVTEGGRDVWRPTVAVSQDGGVVVAWSEQREGNWDVYYRIYRAGGGSGRFGPITRLTTDSGADVYVKAATDARGGVWLVWQAWRKSAFTVLATKLTSGGEVLHLGLEGTNNWSPSIACDRKGTVYVAWDAYCAGSYDVYVAEIAGGRVKRVQVARTARFEARPSLWCDEDGRLWVAYEEGDEQWGKDYIGTGYAKVGFERNPAFGLYVNRTVRVKCFVEGKWYEPAAPLQAALRETTPRARSYPRLCGDRHGGLWLLFRHHKLPSPQGEVWMSFATCLRQNAWSAVRTLTSSENLLDNRPAAVPWRDGILVVYSGDGRTRTNQRGWNDLFATYCAQKAGARSSAALAPAASPEPSSVKPVHPREREDIARLRAFRLQVGGKQLRIIRGEFHRHTEFTSHRDQDGSLEDSWRYGLDAGCLDWMGNGDHDNGYGQQYMWWLIQKVTDIFHHPPMFVAAQSYERSVVYPSGHRNVIIPYRGVRPLPRLGRVRDVLFGSSGEGAPDVKLLYAYLRHFGGMCAVHTSGTNMGTDWRDNDPEVEPVVEIYQGHRHNYEHAGAPRSATAQRNIGGFRPAGFVWNALGKGYRLGFQSSSDHASTHMSYGMLFVEEVSRQAVVDAFKKRHCYGATDNILLVVRAGDHLMGDVFKRSEKPTFTIYARGTAPIRKVHVIRNSKYVFTREPAQEEVSLTFVDTDPLVGRRAYYYVRVDQADGNLAWASPLWITYEP